MTDIVLRRAGAAWQQMRGTDPVWVLIALIPLAQWLLAPDQTARALGISAGAFAGTMPYMAVAIALIAGLKATGAEGMIGAAFRGRESRMIVLAATIGGLAPFCSCEVIPFIAALLAAGTPVSAVMAFWLSSPLMDPPTFAITAGALGPEFAIGKTVAAVAIGLLGGFATRYFVGAGAFAEPLRQRRASGCCKGASAMSGRPVWRFWGHAERRAVFGRTAGEQALFLGKWLTLAYLLEGILIVHVPAEAVVAVVGGEGLVPIITGALVGAPAYLNGYAAPALIAGMMEQGMSAGAAMSFMVAGAVSSIPAMAAVFALVRRPVFAAYLGFGIGGAILSGVVFAWVMAVLS